MFDKIKVIVIVWIGVIIAYVFIAYTHDTADTMANTALVEMASQNLSSEIVGIEEAIGSFNVWKWIIPVFIGIIVTVVELREEIISRVKGE